MASLYRLDVIIRGNSTISIDDAIKWTKNWVNKRQESDKNKNQDGSYYKEFYADLFDSRTCKAWKIFSDVATKNRKITNYWLTEKKEEIEGVIYLTSYIDAIQKLGIEVEFLKQGNDNFNQIINNDEDIKILA